MRDALSNPFQKRVMRHLSGKYQYLSLGLYMHALSHTIPLQLKFAPASEAATGEFSGYASTFGGEPDSQGHIIQAGAFKQTLARHASQGTRPALLWQHTRSSPIGTWRSLAEDPIGLFVTGKLTLDLSLARDAYALAKDGALAMSIGFFVNDEERLASGLRLIKEIDLVEISLVSIPANSRAIITEVKAFDPTNPREFERQVREALGLSSREAKRLMSGGWSALVRDERSDNSEELAVIAKRLEQITNSLRINQ